MPRKRVYHTGNRTGYVVLVLKGATMGLLRQDSRSINEFTVAKSSAGTVFDDKGDAEYALRRYVKRRPGLSLKVVPVGWREVDRVTL